MRLEDPELHKSPDPWRSKQKDLNKKSMIIIPFLMIPGILFLIMAIKVPSKIPYMTYLISFFFIGMGSAFLIGLIYTNLDQKDSWFIGLPYNILLFEKLNNEIVLMFDRKGYNFAPKEISGVYVVKDKKTGVKYAQGYGIKTSYDPELEVKLALEIIQGRYSTTYQFPIEISKIRTNNLQHAYQLQKDIQNMLISAKYDQYKEEH